MHFRRTHKGTNFISLMTRKANQRWKAGKVWLTIIQPTWQTSVHLCNTRSQCRSVNYTRSNEISQECWIMQQTCHLCSHLPMKSAESLNLQAIMHTPVFLTWALLPSKCLQIDSTNQNEQATISCTTPYKWNKNSK